MGGAGNTISYFGNRGNVKAQGKEGKVRDNEDILPPSSMVPPPLGKEGLSRAEGDAVESVGEASETFGGANNGILSYMKNKISGIVNYSQEEMSKISKEGKSYKNYVLGKDISLRDFFGFSRKKSGKFEKLYLGKISFDLAQRVNTVHLNKKANRLNVNRISSIYGKDGIKSFITE